MKRTVWQVPETCEWNPYVAQSGEALSALGWEMLTPGVCVDGREGAGGAAWSGPAPGIVHLHWPDKLAATMGSDEALALLRYLKFQGARVVQTVHNLIPHEASDETRRFIDKVDGLCDGVHFASFEHEAVARRYRPNLPQTSVHFGHPRFGLARPLRLGLFGRLRGYKRTAAFLKVLITEVDAPFEVHVVGHPDEAATAQTLQGFADSDRRLKLELRFRATEHFNDSIAAVDWVLLPYQRLYSSGIAVTALEMGRGLISPSPVGGIGLYGAASDRWITVDPWDDHRAATRIGELANAARPRLTLLSWDNAATCLHDFYIRLLAAPAAPDTEH